MIKQFNANHARLERHRRMRNRLEGSMERPRLSVFRSGHHIYAQVIDDTSGRTLASASSLEEALRNFQVAPEPAINRGTQSGGQPVSQAADSTVEPRFIAGSVELAAEAAPTRGKGAKTAPKDAQKGAQKGAPGKGGKPGAQVKTLLPAAQKSAAKTPVEALVAIANNRKVVIAREVGKLVARRAKEQGVSRVVFDRGGYAYHGRVAALAEGAREIGRDF
jgi:ribosomal protein L18